MAQTVIGLFESDNEAQRAVERLAEIGVNRSQVDVSRGSSESSVNSGEENEGGIKRFFQSLFGGSDDSDRYSRVSSSGATIVTVHAQTSEEAQRAAEILDSCGAMDVDERDSQYTENRVSGSRGISDDRQD